MKRNVKSFAAMLALALMFLSSIQMANTFNYAAASSVDINDLLNQPTSTPQESTSNSSSDVTDSKRDDNDFINSITNVMDATKPESEAVKAFGAKVQKITSIIVQGLTYIFTGALIISKVIDLFYVAIPITRTVLANGYMGNGAVAGTQQQMMNTMNGGMNNGMGGGFGGGGFGGFGGGYGRRGMMNGGMGQGGSMLGGADSQMAMQNQPMRGRLQFVSNAALNAVASESVIGPDGKGQSAFKTYVKDMAISLIAAPLLLVLCITGAVANIGFGIGSFVADVLSGIRF